MSMQDYIHIGVYVECVNPPVVEQKEYMRCMNGECVNYRTGLETPYCPQCGKAADEYQAGEERPSVNKWEVEASIGEALSCVVNPVVRGKITDIWIPNFGGDVELDDIENIIAVELTPHMRETHLWTFMRTRYAQAFAGLIAAYGAYNVTIKWGVVKYTM